MTIWPHEHANFVYRLNDIGRSLDAQIDYIDGLRRDLSDDDHDGTEDTRARLGEARRAIGAAMASVELARDQMPKLVRPERTL